MNPKVDKSKIMTTAKWSVGTFVDDATANAGSSASAHSKYKSMSLLVTRVMAFGRN